MQIEVLGNLRRDGKYKVKIFFQGAPNMFGGRDFGRSYTKLLTPEQLREHLASPALEKSTNVPRELS